MKVLVRHFSGRTPDGMEHCLFLTAPSDTYTEALDQMDKFGVRALEHEVLGITGAAPAGDGWTEYEIPDEEED